MEIGGGVMYQPLRVEQLRVDNELARLRYATSARRPQPEAPERGRRWWPRPQRSSLRLAFAGLIPARASHKEPCVDC